MMMIRQFNKAQRAQAPPTLLATGTSAISLLPTEVVISLSPYSTGYPRPQPPRPLYRFHDLSQSSRKRRINGNRNVHHLGCTRLMSNSSTSSLPRSITTISNYDNEGDGGNPDLGTGLGLGLRRAHPPDTPLNLNQNASSSSPPPGHEPSEDNSKADTEAVSDAEWEIRTGRTIDILRTSLPTFFTTGLMTSWDSETGEAYPSSHPSLSLPVPKNLHIPLPLHLLHDSKHENENEEREKGRGKREAIYGSKIHLTYTPPSPLPHPFPEKLTLDGRSLYLASAVFIRHTMNTLYSDLRVTLVKVAVSVPKDKNSEHNVHSLNPDSDSKPNPAHPSKTQRPAYRRQKSLYIALRVRGKSRMTGAEGQWEVRSTYGFSGVDGRVVRHEVNGIEPAPERGVWEGLARVLGVGEGFGQVGVGGRQGEGALMGCGKGSERGGSGT